MLLLSGWLDEKGEGMLGFVTRWPSERIACVISGFGGGKGVFCRYPIQFVFFTPL